VVKGVSCTDRCGLNNGLNFMPSCLFVSFILYPTLQVGHIRYHGLSWISLVKLFLFRNIDLQRKAATRRTVPKYSKRNRKPEAVILYEVRTAHWEEIVTFFYILGGKNTHAHTHRLMGNLQLNVRKDSYDFDNTTLHVGLYIYIYIYIYIYVFVKFGIWLRGKTQDYLRDVRFPPWRRW